MSGKIVVLANRVSETRTDMADFARTYGPEMIDIITEVRQLEGRDLSGTVVICCPGSRRFVDRELIDVARACRAPFITYLDDRR